MDTLNRCRFTTGTTGSGTTIANGTAVGGGFFNLSGAGAVDGKSYRYLIETSAGDAEINFGAWSASGGTIGRGTPEQSTNGGAKITIPAAGALITILPSAADYTSFAQISDTRNWSTTGVIGIGSNGLKVGDAVACGLYADSTNVAIRTVNATGSAIYIQSYNGSATFATFDPSSFVCRTAATFGSTLSTTGAITSAGNISSNAQIQTILANTGGAAVFYGSASSTGYVAFYNSANATRWGYIGYASTSGGAGNGGNINYLNEQGGSHVFGGLAVIPATDNSTPLGLSNYRWSTIYSASGTINTSDEDQKQDIEPIPDWLLDAWEKVTHFWFRYRQAVLDKGDGARWHTGLTYQQVRDALASSPGPDGQPIDGHTLGLLCWDELPAEEELWSPLQPERPAIAAVKAVPEQPAQEAFEGIPKSVDDDGNVTEWLSPPRPATPYIPAVEARDAIPAVPAVPAKLIRAARAAGAIGGLRYLECDQVEHAYQRRRADRAERRLGDLEAAVTALQKSA